MKKILQGVVALIALGAGASAFAADLPPAPVYKTPVMTPAYYDWSGFYVGLNAGGGSAHNCWDNTRVFAVATVPTIREGCHDATGAIAGGQMGFRWQSGGWVFGVEAQGDWSSLKGSNASIPVAALLGVPALTNQTRIDALGLFTGQVGYAFNNVLGYVKGGAALTYDRYNGLVTGTNAVIDSANETRWGGAVGAGIEFAFAPSWSVGAEYDHLFMGNRNINLNLANFGGSTRNDRISQDADVGTVRVNYRWGGPVISKY